MYAGFVVGNGWDGGVLLDSDDAGETAAKKINDLYLKQIATDAKTKFRVFMLGKATGLGDRDIEIEDIFPISFYLDCVNVAYRASLVEADLPQDGDQRIASRVDGALKKIGHSGLDKKRVVPELLKRFDVWRDIKDVPSEVVTRAEKLFSAINAAYA
jgi:hypothetical protein